jgi:hypothetical protein
MVDVDTDIDMAPPQQAMAYLDTDPTTLAHAAALGLSPASIDRLTLAIEHRRQQLEADIAALIARKQTELRQYEQEVPYPIPHTRFQSLFKFHFQIHFPSSYPYPYPYTHFCLSPPYPRFRRCGLR